jgi:hypothetical protein
VLEQLERHVAADRAYTECPSSPESVAPCSGAPWQPDPRQLTFVWEANSPEGWQEGDCRGDRRRSAEAQKSEILAIGRWGHCSCGSSAPRYFQTHLRNDARASPPEWAAKFQTETSG